MECNGMYTMRTFKEVPCVHGGPPRPSNYSGTGNSSARKSRGINTMRKKRFAGLNLSTVLLKAF